MARARLLLVDDDDAVLSGLGIVLEESEFEVTTATNVNEALKHITSKSFDVLISDLHMPGEGDGLIVVNAMRQANPKAVTLLLSANPDMTKASAAILREVDKIVLKPAKAGSIVQMLRERMDQEEPLPCSLSVEGGRERAGTGARFGDGGVAAKDEGNRRTVGGPPDGGRAERVSARRAR